MIAVRDQVELDLRAAAIRAHMLCVVIYDLHRVRRVRVIRVPDGTLAVRVRLPWYRWFACGLWHLWVRHELLWAFREKGVSSIWTY